MTSFRFIHAADLHLGSPFQGLALKDAALAEIFVAASRTAFSSLVTTAIDLKTDFLVIAGDVYDGDWKDNTIGLFFNREMARLERAAIPVFLLKGNHDAESVITRTISLPRNVHEFPVNKPGSHRIETLKVALHGQGFAERSANENLALSYPPAVPGWFNIGVLHTSLTGREPHQPYAPCSVEDLRSRSYDYWALGHVHDYEVVSEDPLVVFPGNIQGRSIRETGAKGAVLVSVEDGRIALERIYTDQARFAELSVPVAADDRLNDLLQKVEAGVGSLAVGMDDKPLAVRVRFAGESLIRSDLLARLDDLRDEVQAACHRAHHDIWLEKFEMKVATPAAAAAQDLLGLEGLIPAGAFSADLLAETAARIGEIAARLPGGIGAGQLPLGDDAEALLAEARDLLTARAARID